MPLRQEFLKSNNHNVWSNRRCGRGRRSQPRSEVGYVVGRWKSRGKINWYGDEQEVKKSK